jgi:hypothetical protein
MKTRLIVASVKFDSVSGRDLLSGLFAYSEPGYRWRFRIIQKEDELSAETIRGAIDEGADGIGVICDYGFSNGISCISVKGSGFEQLSHRAVMGSILGLGVERDAIGDIVMIDGHNALFFCDSRLSDFFCESLERVGRDKVRLGR